MTEHLPECPRSGCPACYEQGQHDCALTHAIRGLKDINRIAARGYDDGQRDALAAARRIVAGFLDIDPDTGDRRCSDPTCDLCVVAPLIYAAFEDLSAGGQS